MDPMAGVSKADAQRQRVLMASTEIFSKRGYRGTSMNEIAAITSPPCSSILCLSPPPRSRPARHLAGKSRRSALDRAVAALPP
jgi:hypothetical protein